MSGNCPRCEAAGNELPDRKCAFRGPFFSPDNWNCASINALLDAFDPERLKAIYASDESIDIVPCDPDRDRGWIVLTRYKRRGRVSSAVHLGDHDPGAVTLGLVDATVDYYAKQEVG